MKKRNDAVYIAKIEKRKERIQRRTCLVGYIYNMYLCATWIQTSVYIVCAAGPVIGCLALNVLYMHKTRELFEGSDDLWRRFFFFDGDRMSNFLASFSRAPDTSLFPMNYSWQLGKWDAPLCLRWRNDFFFFLMSFSLFIRLVLFSLTWFFFFLFFYSGNVITIFQCLFALNFFYYYC